MSAEPDMDLFAKQEHRRRKIKLTGPEIFLLTALSRAGTRLTLPGIAATAPQMHSE